MSDDGLLRKPEGLPIPSGRLYHFIFEEAQAFWLGAASGDDEYPTGTRCFRYVRRLA